MLEFFKQQYFKTQEELRIAEEYQEKLILEMGMVLRMLKEAIENDDKEKINEIFKDYLYEEEGISRFCPWAYIRKIY